MTTQNNTMEDRSNAEPISSTAENGKSPASDDGWEKRFRERFMRDDGLMDKYEHIEDKDSPIGFDCVPTGEAIIGFFREEIKLIADRGEEYRKKLEISVQKEVCDDIISLIRQHGKTS